MTADAESTDLSIAGAPWLTSTATQRVFAALTASGHQARAVGGCVRDTLLARLQPPGPAASAEMFDADIDIATTSEPEETMALAERAGLRAVPTGVKHGTVTVVASGVGYEVTTLRHDVETYGRHADVAFTDDWALDAARRDFTINALYANPDGSLFDPLGGLPDLVARRVRFVGDPHQRIREDYLRILRFFRFLARFGEAPPEPESLAACIAERAGLRRLSRERIGHEMMRLIIARRAVDTVALMAENGILAEVLPVAAAPPRLRALDELETALGCPPDAALRLAALTMHVAEDAPRVAAALRLSNSDRDVLSLWSETSLDIATAVPAEAGCYREADLRRSLYRLGAGNYRRRLLIEACYTGSWPGVATLAEAFTLPARWSAPPLPVSGRDLLALGVPPGPAVGDLLSELEAAWIESDFTLSRDDLCTRAERHLRPPPRT
jgi:poly(A) polymerase